MGWESEPEAVISPSSFIGLLDSIPVALSTSILGTALLSPFAGRLTGMLPVAVDWTPLARLSVVFLPLFVAALAVAGLRAVGHRLATEYRIYDGKVEIRRGLVREQRQVLPRSKIQQVTVSGGVLAAHFGGGDIEITVRSLNTKFDVTMRHVGTADHWYRHLRPVSGTQPVETVSRSIGPDLFRQAGYLTVTVGLFAGVVTLGTVLGILGVSLPSILLVALLVALAVLWRNFLYLASTKYHIFDDHIERHRIFFGRERSYVIAEQIEDVDHERSVLERLFDVGTIEIRASWREEPFYMRSVGEAEQISERLRQVT